MGEGEQAFCRAGENIGPRVSEQVFDQGNPLFGPVKEVDLNKGAAGLLERSDLAGCQRSGISVDRDDRVPRSEQECGGSLLRDKGGGSCPFAKEVIERFPPAVSREAFQGHNTFLDTPGHEAFTAMRARGAQATDIAVLVVAADDGVMPQTKEAIAHARAAHVPIIVALNKIDKANANPERVKKELNDAGVVIDEYGGEVLLVPVSAKQKKGIDDLLEAIILIADTSQIKANPDRSAVGTVIEGRLDKSLGAVASVLVQNGTLKAGDGIVLGNIAGRVRTMYDDKGKPIQKAGPSTPVLISGLIGVPVAGDHFETVKDEKAAKAIVAERINAQASGEVGHKTLTLADVFSRIQAGEVKELPIILKADVQGSIEPILNQLEKLNVATVKVKVLHSSTGTIGENDVQLAIASGAIVIGFNVGADNSAKRLADSESVDVRLYDIIYRLTDDIQKALTGMLEPTYKEIILGTAEVRQVFKIKGVGNIAGSMVRDGVIQRGVKARVKRGSEVIHEGGVASLKRLTEEVKEVKAGYECGIGLANFQEFKKGDLIEFYTQEKVT